MGNKAIAAWAAFGTEAVGAVGQLSALEEVEAILVVVAEEAQRSREAARIAAFGAEKGYIKGFSDSYPRTSAEAATFCREVENAQKTVRDNAQKARSRIAAIRALAKGDEE